MRDIRAVFCFLAMGKTSDSFMANNVPAGSILCFISDDKLMEIVLGNGTLYVQGDDDTMLWPPTSRQKKSVFDSLAAMDVPKCSYGPDALSRMVRPSL